MIIQVVFGATGLNQSILPTDIRTLLDVAASIDRSIEPSEDELIYSRLGGIVITPAATYTYRSYNKGPVCSYIDGLFSFQCAMFLPSKSGVLNNWRKNK